MIFLSSCQVAVDYAHELADTERLRDRLSSSAGEELPFMATCNSI